MKLTKLDTYESYPLPGLIKVRLEGTNDAQAADILSELSRTNNMLYLDGEYYEFLGESIMESSSEGVFLVLEVIRCEVPNTFRRKIDND